MGSDTFTYDLVSRLRTASVTASDGSHTQSAGFDTAGNVTSLTNDLIGQSPALTTDAATNHLANGTYDGAGNLKTWNGAVYGWDGFNQLETVQNTGIARYNAYSASAERLLMRDQNLTTLTLRGLDNKVLRDITYDPSQPAGQQWRWAKDYVYRDGSLLASVSAADGIRHYTLDHLGSPRLLTDRCGERKKLFTHLPFGQEVPLASASDPEDRERMRFTVHERDIGLADNPGDDLDYMHARMYQPPTGRFASPDEDEGDSVAPQTWNRFAYARGNPTTRVDPDGKKDYRTHEELEMLESPAVLAAWGQALDMCRCDALPRFRVETGATILNDGGGQHSATEVSVGTIRSVELDTVHGGHVSGYSGTVEAAFHLHVVDGTQVINGESKTFRPECSSDADHAAAVARGVPSYILNQQWSIFKYDPKIGHDQPVLDGKDLKNYLSRAREQYRKKKADDRSHGKRLTDQDVNRLKGTE